MKLVVGLGNVGKEYVNTRHNLGFGVVDLLATSFGQVGKFTKSSKASAEVLDLKSSHGCVLVKPTTMMNLSGQAVGELARFYKIEAPDIWLVYDDVDLPFGQIRVRHSGGSAGHNGIKSVIEHIGDSFWRVRLGIANQFLPTTPTDKFVLDPFSKQEAANVPAILEAASKIITEALIQGQLDEHSKNLDEKL